MHQSGAKTLAQDEQNQNTKPVDRKINKLYLTADHIGQKFDWRMPSCFMILIFKFSAAAASTFSNWSWIFDRLQRQDIVE